MVETPPPLPARPNLHVALALALGRQPDVHDRVLLADVVALRAIAGPLPVKTEPRYADVPLPGMEVAA